MLRKVMSVIITFTLFLGILTPVGYGDVKSSILTKVEAEKLAREKLDLEKDYKLEYSNLHTRDIQQRQFWNLEFIRDKSNASIVMAADSGEIISVNHWNGETYGKAVELLEDDAERIAVEFIQSLQSERFKETEKVTVKAPTIIPYDIKINDADDDHYHFMFVRKIGGEFFPNNYFRVTVSGVNGNVTSYEMKWDTANYEGNKELISEAKVKELFKKEDRLKLKYVRLNKYNEEESKNVILTPVYVYMPKESDKIDAVTGKLLSFDELYNWNYYGYPIYREGSALENEMMDKAASDDTAEMVPEEGVISKERAEQIVVDMLKSYVDIDGIKLNSTSYTNYYAGMKGKFWSIYSYSNEGIKYLSAVVNAENGQVIEVSYNKNQRYEPIQELSILKNTENIEENSIKNEDNLHLLKDKIQRIFPKTENGIKLELQEYNMANQEHIYASSSRYIDNIPFEDNFIRIGYNTKTNEITNLNYRWYDVVLQKGNSILNNEKASEIFYDKVGFEKYLVQLKDLEKYETEGLELPKKELLPVYGIKSFGFNYMNALTGQFLNYSGEEFKNEENNQTYFMDIQGSPYEREILLMDKMGVLNVEDGTFKPEKALIQKDAIKWIVEIGWSNKAYSVDRYYAQSSQNKDEDYLKGVSKDSSYYKYIKAAVAFGILEAGDDFNPEDKASKMQLTQWIINAMKQKELAKYSSIFQAPYKDAESIETENTGYAALAKYYNIFGDKNMDVAFESNKNLNRDEFIHMMYQFIKNYKDMNK